MFVNRTKELLFLDNLLAKEGPKLLFLSGGQGTGKTELLARFIRKRRGFFFPADYGSSLEQLVLFKKTAYRISNTLFFKSKKCSSWPIFLDYIMRRAAKKIPVVIIDNFPFLCESVKNITEILKEQWLNLDKKNPLFLILSGANRELMKGLSLDETWISSGAAVEYKEIEPFDFEKMSAVFPDISANERVFTYAILGGKPQYLQHFNRLKSLEQNIKREILDKNSFLYREPYGMLLHVLREPSLYFAILKAIAFDHNQVRDIVEETGLKNVHMVNKYLYVLRKLGIIRRICPVTELDPERSRKGMYVFEDSYHRFWFRFVQTNLSCLEMSDTAQVWQTEIKPYLNGFSEMTFRDICMQRLRRENKYGKLPFVAEKIGPWWNRKASIDIVALGASGDCLYCACSWSDRRMGLEALHGLKAKAEYLPCAGEKYFGLFCKSGFSRELKAASREDDHILLLLYY